MTTMLEIEAAIKPLPDRDVRQLAAWLQTYLDDRWDLRMRDDLASGRLDRPIALCRSRHRR